MSDGRDIAPYDEQKVNSDKMVAAILAILLGGFGVHKFIMGKTSTGIIQLVLTVVTCGLSSVIGLVEGVIYLTKSNEDYYNTYIAGDKNWF